MKEPSRVFTRCRELLRASPVRSSERNERVPTIPGWWCSSGSNVRSRCISSGYLFEEFYFYFFHFFLPSPVSPRPSADVLLTVVFGTRRALFGTFVSSGRACTWSLRRPQDAEPPLGRSALFEAGELGRLQNVTLVR